ncbi:MAG TPA: phosphoribosylaminoimidazolesuccinocarboxamide synthase [Chitinophagaceae bacterium]|nr:phosphoribosylaminoimidazolesuccinocarboxamide synthase [Chitinophagaceae bacterium]
MKSNPAIKNSKAQAAYFYKQSVSMAQYSFPGQTNFYSGKVRDVYSIGTEWLVMIASDRISAFDVILPRPIPFKGQVLNQIAAYMLEATRDICPNWLVNTPAPHVSIGRRCQPFRIEMVVRGNLTGHAWRTYASGKRMLCGINLPGDMKENDYFPSPIITPSTKAAEGHDEDISKEEIIKQGLATAGEWEILEDYTLKLFARGKEIAAHQGLILVDTKYEFGKIGDTIYLMDEIHTPDSSRYFYADGFEERQEKGERQRQLSKEFVREWLIANDFMGKEGQSVPAMSDEWVNTISQRYIELYEKVIGAPFKPEPLGDEETFERIIVALEKLKSV